MNYGGLNEVTLWLGAAVLDMLGTPDVSCNQRLMSGLPQLTLLMPFSTFDRLQFAFTLRNVQ